MVSSVYLRLLIGAQKQRHHSTDKGHIVKSMVFPVVMYGCKSWTIEKADAEELMAIDLQVLLELFDAIIQRKHGMDPKCNK